MMSKQRYLWLAVTADGYELPLIVEDTAAALARRLGVSEERYTVPGKIKRYELLGRGILLQYERDDILLRGRL